VEPIHQVTATLIQNWFLTLTDMQEFTHDDLRDRGMQRDLNPAEQAHLQKVLTQNPDLTRGWEEDQQLNHLIRHLPNRPISSNFTQLVLQAVTRSEVHAAVLSPLPWWTQFWHAAWIRPAAIAGLLICLGSLGYQQHQSRVRWEIARSLVTVSELSKIAQPEVVKNFDVIDRLNRRLLPVPAQLRSPDAGPVDYALLAALQ
jgi:hypothetical protein